MTCAPLQRTIQAVLIYDIVASALPEELRPYLDSVAAELGVEIAGASLSLAAYPGSQHWHLKRPGRTGTLEVTWWPERAKLWVSVHANRDGGWAGQTCPKFARALAARLGGRARKRPPSGARR